jgi:hypothetical protein
VAREIKVNEQLRYATAQRVCCTAPEEPEVYSNHDLSDGETPEKRNILFKINKAGTTFRSYGAS